VSQNVLPAVFGVDGQPCAGCGAPLAGDQRYCLYCGSRRAEARLEFMDALAGGGPAPIAGAGGAGGPVAPGHQLTVGGVSEPPAGHGLGAWLRANTAVLALAGLLMGMLFIGLLVGHWATSGTTTPAPAQAAAPQVIRVEGSGGGAAAADDAAADSAVDSAADAKKDTKKAKAAKDTQVVQEVPKDAVDVNKLNSLSGKAKAKAIDDAVKKGKPISTGTGKLPPKDDKAPGGGTEFETIG